MTTYWCPAAWLPPGPAERVRVDVVGDRITAVRTGADPVPGDHPLPGLVLPGFADVHSHAFHRALRGRTHRDGGDFWQWRTLMYAVAEALTPESYLALAREVYAGLVLGGVTAVGEFHYVHHPPGGGRYDDPNVMGEALVAAAADAGLRLTLLDTCYLSGGIGMPLERRQARFSDGDATRWAERVEALADREDVRIGAAVHSVRAVPLDQMPTVVAWARSRGAPLHLHLSEQPAENEACHAAYGRTPTEVVAQADVLGPLTTAVHAVHVTEGDIALLGASGTSVCLCPTTERDLGDGLAPGAALHAAGSPLCVGSDQHVADDVLAEVREVELHARIASGRRGVLTPAVLTDALTVAGHRALGWADAGRIAVGARADLVAVRTDTVRTAGVAPAEIVMAATAADVDTVVAGGRVVVRDGVHRTGDVGPRLARAVRAVLEAAR